MSYVLDYRDTFCHLLTNFVSYRHNRMSDNIPTFRTYWYVGTLFVDCLHIMSCTYNIVRPMLYVHVVRTGMYRSVSVIGLHFMSHAYNIVRPMLYVHVVRLGMYGTLFVITLHFMSRT